jgi:hypothetical protein
MKKIKIKTHSRYGNVFSIVNTLNGTYVCPGWYPIPSETTREQIEFELINHVDVESTLTEVKKTLEVKIYEVESSKPGNFYKVKNNKGTWSCTCPSAAFHRGDCKHIKKIKNNQ